jgi:hypothetical protein
MSKLFGIEAIGTNLILCKDLSKIRVTVFSFTGVSFIFDLPPNL